MSKSQKLAITVASFFYVMTIFAGFCLSLAYILIFFVLFTLSIIWFAYLCFNVHNDYTGADHLQQEIGMLRAEKEQLKVDCEKTVEEKNSDIRKMQTQLDDMEAKLKKTEEDLIAAQENVSIKEDVNIQTSIDSSIESLLPPDDEDPAVTVDIIDVARKAIAELKDAAREAGLVF